MIWSPEEELDNTCRAVREHCEKLKPEGYQEADEDTTSPVESSGPIPTVAVGVERDLELHKNDVITTDAYVPPPRVHAAEVTTDEDRDDEKDQMFRKQEVIVLDDSDEEKQKGNEDSDDEIKVVAVIPAK